MKLFGGLANQMVLLRWFNNLSQHMLLDSRLVGLNATTSTRDDWARDCWPQVELIWSYMIILSFARLLRIDPVIIHVLSILWKLLPDTAAPLVLEIEGLGI